jgi:hypothetical protein
MAAFMSDDYDSGSSTSDNYLPKGYIPNETDILGGRNKQQPGNLAFLQIVKSH